ncbi:enoyl-CoA hydratase/isomerase family protein [Spongiibacter sp. KMU-166]|uniref:Enoyl-CoA hydratase/isomerase family protein n=1 Tax=Spongiibacter thalassae TaxID=2721624 RepID=A0ABX1GCK5_9GAMM|nr:enoyl-CoA hydratase-related protein [Spongiibacter thalassae]NKI16137.1 enoyl-CoA hydratase/isomerase family protein [Spongiibacter thalassae]
MSDFNTIDVSVDGGVATVCLNRPSSLNAFNSELRKELLAGLRSVAAQPEVRVIVLGARGRGFSSGADLAEAPKEGQTVERLLLDEYVPILSLIESLEQPVIAAVPGVMAGVGAAFALHCDLSVMADDAKMVMAFSNVGLVPDGGATWNLLRNLGYQRAFKLIAEGGSLDAQSCLDCGLVTMLAPADEVLSTAQAWAKQLAERAPIALREAKTLLRNAATQSYATTAAAEAKAQLVCVASEDSQEAIQAFMEKRPAVFKGK